jgi:hypothetical protein
LINTYQHSQDHIPDTIFTETPQKGKHIPSMQVTIMSLLAFVARQ